MNKIKVSVLFFVLLVSMLCCNFIAVAETQSNSCVIDIADKSSVNELGKKIAKAVSSGNTADVEKQYFTVEAYKQFLKITEQFDYELDYYKSTVETSSYLYSTTKDDVMFIHSYMIGYNKTYTVMLECHVNEAGKIYGMNLWVF